MIATGVTDSWQQRVLLLHLVGQDAQDISETFTDIVDTSDNTITKIDEYFLPRKNDALEKHLVRKCKQNPGE